jgi:hypothetical protein
VAIAIKISAHAEWGFVILLSQPFEALCGRTVQEAGAASDAKVRTSVT